MFYTYIIYSATSDVYYKGFSIDSEHRLWEHNNGRSEYTAGKGPWKLVYFKEFETRREALIDEKRLKKLNRCSLEILTKNHISDNEYPIR